VAYVEKAKKGDRRQSMWFVEDDEQVRRCALALMPVRLCACAPVRLCACASRGIEASRRPCVVRLCVFSSTPAVVHALMCNTYLVLDISVCILLGVYTQVSECYKNRGSMLNLTVSHL
jgi:hypothetical protein